MWSGKESVTAIFSMSVIGFALLVTPACAGDAKAEIDFVTRASIGNLFAIAESRLAIDRTNDPEVKGHSSSSRITKRRRAPCGPQPLDPARRLRRCLTGIIKHA